MKKPSATYKVHEFINVKEHPAFILLEKYFKYGSDYDYIAKAKECILQLNWELSTDPELLSILEKHKFKKE